MPEPSQQLSHHIKLSLSKSIINTVYDLIPDWTALVFGDLNFVNFRDMSFRVHRTNSVIPRHQQPPIFTARGRVDRLVDALDRDHGRHLWVVVDVGDEALDPDMRRL